MRQSPKLAAGAATVLPDTQQNGLASWQPPADGSHASHASSPLRPSRDPSASSRGAAPTAAWADMSLAARGGLPGLPVAAGNGLVAHSAPSTAGTVGDAAPPVTLRVLEPHSPGQAQKPRLRVGEGDILVRSGRACCTRAYLLVGSVSIPSFGARQPC